jgi:RNA polymerase sigma-70 factor, ECF subfamily
MPASFHNLQRGPTPPTVARSAEPRITLLSSIHIVTKSYRKPVPVTSSDYGPPLHSAAFGSAVRPIVNAGGAPVADTHHAIEAEIPRLRRYARALTRDVVSADDLVQDCLTRALGKLHLWQEGSDLRAWLFTILHNQYVNYIRRAVREGATVALNETEPMLSRAPQQGKRLELRDLERAIAQLPAEQRSVILLVGLEGMRYEEVAAVLDVPVGTIRSRLSRGREALRRLTGAVPDEKPEATFGESKPPCVLPRHLRGPTPRSRIAVNGGRLPPRPGPAKNAHIAGSA